MKFALPLILVILVLSSCQKDLLLDQSNNEESISLSESNDATAAGITGCKIRRIYQGPEDNPYYYTGLFSYTKAGNPYSVLYSAEMPDYYFFYDSKNRLIAHTEHAYGITWRHYYRHNSLGQIIIDSSINPGSDLQDTTIWVATLEYDSKGRVVKETIVNTRNDGSPLAPIRRPTYTYDNRGNLGVLGWKSSSYDYKVNPLRLSPVFQFIFRNYSMNNAAPQPRYNSAGLPLAISSTNDPFFNWLDAAKIIYECP